MILAAVFLLSLSSLAIEVLLTRVFSIGQWNHLSFMVISIALFGFAASGTFLSVLESRREGRGKRLFATGPVAMFILLYTATAIASFIVLNELPLDYFRLPLEPIQSLYLLSAFLLLALPFFFTGLVISLSYAFLPEKTGFVYFAGMAGSAVGALIPALLLPVFGEGRLILVVAMVPLVWLPFAVIRKDLFDGRGDPAREDFLHKKRIYLPATGFGILIISALLVFSHGGSAVDVKPSPYKALSQILQFPDTRIVETETDLRGRVDRTESPYTRFAPGLSLKFGGVLPEQQSIYRDGDNPFVLYGKLRQPGEHFSQFTHTYAGYLLVEEPEKVLLIQSGGGSAVPCAIAAGARSITVVQQNPHIARMIREHYNLHVVPLNPRAFLARNHTRFDVIHVENWGTSLPGTDALTEEGLYTIQAFTEYLEHLTANGVLIVSRRLLLPPADAVRIWATAYESLKSMKIERPEHCLAMLRNWDTFTLIVSRRPLQQVGKIEDFSRKMNFDFIYAPGITPEMANRFNVFEAPFHFLEISRLLQAYRSGTEKVFFQNYLLDAAPQTDSRPFPGRFLKWSRLRDLYKSTGSRLYSLLLSGEVVVGVVFLEALLISFVLLVLPLFAIPGNRQKPTVAGVFYFLAVGAGFMFVELFFIKGYTLIYGDPVISFTVVLAGILVFSSVGGFWSSRMTHRGLRNGLFALIVVLLLTCFGMDAAVRQMLGVSGTLGFALPVLFLLPCGVLMGLPFPLGMRCLLNNPAQRAYAWAANGCFSVLAAIISAQIALSQGIPAIMVCAILAYMVALLSSGKR
ncbi:MAG: hypothetical protein ABII68_11605 [Pseudomonadota bacterium]